MIPKFETVDWIDYSVVMTPSDQVRLASYRRKLLLAQQKVDYYKKQMIDAEDRYSQKHQDLVELYTMKIDDLKSKHKKYLSHLNGMKSYLETKASFWEERIKKLQS